MHCLTVWERHTAYTGHGFDVNKIIHYLQNSGHVFRRYTDRLTFSFVSDYAPQFGNATAHYDVKSSACTQTSPRRPPGLSARRPSSGPSPKSLDIRLSERRSQIDRRPVSLS